MSNIEAKTDTRELRGAPSLYDGVFDEVTTDFNKQPLKFLVKLQYRLEKENPLLEHHFYRNDEIPDPYLSQEWVAIYYEMQSRSSKKVGQAMPKIDTETYTAVMERMEADETAIYEASEEDLPQLERDFRLRMYRNRLRDEAMGPEMVKFWEFVDEGVKEKMIRGDSELEAMTNSEQLLIVQQMLQRQRFQDESILIENA